MQCTEVNNKHKMTFAKFKVALNSIAELLGVDVVEVKKAIASSSGPLLHNVTLPQYHHLQESPGAERAFFNGAEKLGAETAAGVPPRSAD